MIQFAQDNTIRQSCHVKGIYCIQESLGTNENYLISKSKRENTLQSTNLPC